MLKQLLGLFVVALGPFCSVVPATADTPDQPLTVSVIGGPPLSIGGEIEYKLSGSPFKVQAAGTYFPLFSMLYLHALGTVGFNLGHNTTFGLVAGVNRPMVTKLVCPGPAGPGDSCSAFLPMGYTIGVTFSQQWQSFWWRLTPNFASRGLSTGKNGGIAGLPEPDWLTVFLIGPPLIEVGYELSPDLTVSLRSTAAPLSVSWKFPRQKETPAEAGETDPTLTR